MQQIKDSLNIISNVQTTEACNIGTGAAGLLGVQFLLERTMDSMLGSLPPGGALARPNKSCTPKETSCAGANATGLCRTPTPNSLLNT